ncbi:MAG: serine hydrolase domain-containing protein [Bacillota bacterium]
MRKLLHVILVLVVCLANQVNVLGAEQTGRLPSGLAYAETEKIMDAYVAQHEETTAAVSIAVFVRNKVLLEKYYGHTDIEADIPNNSQAVFEWGSCTKLLTWVSVMQLAEQGAIDLEKDIRAYLPDGLLRKLRYDAPITMLNLMNHNAGWQETVTDLFIKDKADVKELGAALRLTEPEQVFKPGSIVAYSNWGTALAGYIVERVSGLPFSAYVHKNIFEPLGMEQTALSPDLSDNQWVAEKRDQEKCYTADNKPLGVSRYYLSLYPAGGAVGTLSDFVRFAQAFVPAEGEPSPLFAQRTTLDEMLSPSLRFANGETVRNCHGFWTDEFAAPVLWHNGGTLGHSSWFTFDPKSGTGLVVLTNQRHEEVYNGGLLPVVFGKSSHGQTIAAPAPIAGVYVMSRSVFRGFAKPYSLFTTMQLKPNGEGRYTVPGKETTVTGIGPSSYLMDMGGYKTLLYADRDERGRTILQVGLGAADYIKVNGYGLIAEVTLLLVFVVAVLYSLTALITRFIGFLRRKGQHPASGYRTGVDLAVTAVGLLFTYVAVTLFTSSTARFASIQWALMAIAALAFVPVVYGVLLALRWKELHCTKSEKAWLIVSGLSGLIMACNVVFWEAYKFW